MAHTTTSTHTTSTHITLSSSPSVRVAECRLLAVLHTIQGANARYLHIRRNTAGARPVAFVVLQDDGAWYVAFDSTHPHVTAVQHAAFTAARARRA